MKRKFYFHRQNMPLESDHVIYRVWIGESVREQRILTQLLSWSFAHGATLRSWGEDIDFYLLIEAERVFKGRGLLDFGFASAELSGAELLDLMIHNQFESYEQSLSLPKNFITQISTLEPSRLKRNSSGMKNHTVLSSKRQNLSQKNDTKPFIISFI